VGRQEQGHDQQRGQSVPLSRDGKPLVVYVAPKKQFLTVKAFDHLRGVHDKRREAEFDVENDEQDVSSFSSTLCSEFQCARQQRSASYTGR
jgi:hypothetical protein